MASGHLKIKKGLVLYLYWPLGITLLRVWGPPWVTLVCGNGWIATKHCLNFFFISNYTSNVNTFSSAKLSESNLTWRSCNQPHSIISTRHCLVNYFRWNWICSFRQMISFMSLAFNWWVFQNGWLHLVDSYSCPCHTCLYLECAILHTLSQIYHQTSWLKIWWKLCPISLSFSQQWYMHGRGCKSTFGLNWKATANLERELQFPFGQSTRRVYDLDVKFISFKKKKLAANWDVPCSMYWCSVPLHWYFKLQTIITWIIFLIISANYLLITYSVYCVILAKKHQIIERDILMQ